MKQKTKPEKWCVQTTNQSIVDYCNVFGEKPLYSINEHFAHFPPYKCGCATSNKIEEGYTLLSEEEFENIILRGWYIQGNKNQDFINWAQKYFNTTIGFYSDKYYVIKDGKITFHSKYLLSDFYEINIETWYKLKNLITNTKIKGFKLIKKYPGCKHDIGYVEPYTTGEFEKYPEFWEAIYILPYIKIQVGSPSQDITINREGIIFDKKLFPIKVIKQIIKDIEQPTISIQNYNDFNITPKIDDFSIQIGCTIFTKKEAYNILDIYNKNFVK